MRVGTAHPVALVVVPPPQKSSAAAPPRILGKRFRPWAGAARVTRGCTLGAWYAEIPITNVPSERVFAIMRSCEGHLRHNLTEDSMTEEVSAKCNDWVLEGMVQRQVQLFGRR